MELIDIRKEHHQVELLRLQSGLDGCGCKDCQDLYKNLDLGQFGSRVTSVEGSVNVNSGRTGAILWDDYHKQDSWTTGIEKPQDSDNKPPKGKKAVAKIPTKEILPPPDIQAQVEGIMKHRGRPRKTGEVSRFTSWRRGKETAIQGRLLEDIPDEGNKG